MTPDHAKEMYDRFMRDVRNGDYPHLVDAADAFDEGSTGAEVAYVVAEGLNISLSEAIDCLASVDVDALRRELLP
jgi:hypothetical protein